MGALPRLRLTRRAPADGTASVFKTVCLPATDVFAALNEQYVERIVKFLLFSNISFLNYSYNDLKPEHSNFSTEKFLSESFNFRPPFEV